MISNQYQIQPNFQGNLFKEGLKLPKKKFNEVAKIYAEKSEGMPDLHLYGMKHDMDGHFFYSTYAIPSLDKLNKSGFRALITTETLQQMFKDYAPTKMAQELVNITKKFVTIKQLENLDKEIDVLYADMNKIRSQIKNANSIAERDELETRLSRIEQKIDYKEEKVKDLKHKSNWLENELSHEWDVIES